MHLEGTSAQTSAKVLIVDDATGFADNLADILQQCLTDHATSCYPATSVQEAQRLSEDHEFQLALVDLHLPDASGLELLSFLKRRQPFTQVIFVTADSTAESAISALQNGAFGYVIKPFRVEAFVETAAQALSKARLLSESARLRRELEQSRHRHREVIDKVPAFVMALNEEGSIVLWNSQLERTTGFRAEEMLGKAGPELSEAAPQKLAMLGGGHRSVRWKLATLPEGKDGAPVTYAVGVDVTDELEMQRRAMRAERLAAVGTLAAGLAHEVRNPLNSAALQLQLLRRRAAKPDPAPEELQHIVGIISDEIERLDSLVKEFLDFARPEHTTPEPTDIGRLVSDVMRLVKPEADAAGVHATLELAPVGLVPLDPRGIRQVLLNLIRNAIDAMQATGGKLAVRVRAADNAAVWVDVQDDGEGFPTDSPVFDAFYTTKEKGTGLGLAIAHRIVSEHGGAIEVESAPGRTCFSFRLPQDHSG